MADIIHLLLAAGKSHRMGQAKQLLPWGDKTLIEHQIDTCLKTNNHIVVVLGANSQKIMQVIEKLPVTILINKEWESGMGNSLAFGIKEITEKFINTKGVLISLSDQPMITPSYLKKIQNIFQPGKKQIVASQSISGWTGVPALFDKFYFDEIQNLKGEEGARKIIRKYEENLKVFKCKNEIDDIDTLEDYHRLIKDHSHKSNS